MKLLMTKSVYKGIKEGVEVAVVPLRYTSQTCHKCLHIGLRSNKSFKCTNIRCNWKGDADFNGANMISLLGQSVSLPGGSFLRCVIEHKVRHQFN